MTQASANDMQAREERRTPALAALHARRPRDSWATLPPGGLAATWLSMHDSLREGQAMLERLATHWQLKLIDGASFRSRALPVLRQHLGHLHGHHRLEDTHYFPQFRALAPEVAGGIDLLEADHAALHAGIDGLEDSTRRLASADAADPQTDALIQHMAASLHRFGPALRQHLLDEEDLVIPLLALAQESAAR